jgi:hypothetical protein
MNHNIEILIKNKQKNNLTEKVLKIKLTIAKCKFLSPNWLLSALKRGSKAFNGPPYD